MDKLDFKVKHFCASKPTIKKMSQEQWLTPATWEVEVGGLQFEVSLGAKSYGDPISKNKLDKSNIYNPSYKGGRGI
jgi:hypothetical protein